MDSERLELLNEDAQVELYLFYLRYSGGRRNCRHRLKLPQKQKKSPPK